MLSVEKVLTVVSTDSESCKRLHMRKHILSVIDHEYYFKMVLVAGLIEQLNITSAGPKSGKKCRINR